MSNGFKNAIVEISKISQLIIQSDLNNKKLSLSEDIQMSSMQRRWML